MSSQGASNLSLVKLLLAFQLRLNTPSSGLFYASNLRGTGVWPHAMNQQRRGRESEKPFCVWAAAGKYCAMCPIDSHAEHADPAHGCTCGWDGLQHRASRQWVCGGCVSCVTGWQGSRKCDVKRHQLCHSTCRRTSRDCGVKTHLASASASMAAMTESAAATTFWGAVLLSSVSPSCAAELHACWLTQLRECLLFANATFAHHVHGHWLDSPLRRRQQVPPCPWVSERAVLCRR